MPDSPATGHSLPLVAILGRPNVGKSTLFNRLLGENRAIVEDQPGVTRDRHYATVTQGPYTFRLVDTGGILFGDGHPLGEAIRKQALFALEEADALIYVFDARDGYNPMDQEIVERIRASGKPAVFAINKSDSPTRELLLMADFYKYGVEPLRPISSLHGLGMDELLEPLSAILPRAQDVETDPDRLVLSGETEEEIRARIQKRLEEPARIAVIGRPNVGKSTLINRLLGEERLITSPIPGTTRDAIDTLVTYREKNYRFVDTAGIRKRGKLSEASELYAIIRTERALLNAEIAVVLISTPDGVTDGDLRIIRQVIDARRGLILAFNKWDAVPKDETPDLSLLGERYPFLAFAPVINVSALTGRNLGSLFRHIEEVRSWYYRRIATSELNRVILPVLAKTPPPRLKTGAVRILYATQVQIAPTVIYLFSNRPDGLSPTYLQFLTRKIRERHPFTGVPFLLKPKGKKED
jgi:GTP-binding protein